MDLRGAGGACFLFIYLFFYFILFYIILYYYYYYFFFERWTKKNPPPCSCFIHFQGPPSPGWGAFFTIQRNKSAADGPQTYKDDEDQDAHDVQQRRW